MASFLSELKAEVFAENEGYLGGEGCEKLLWGVREDQVEAPTLDTVAPEFSPAALQLRADPQWVLERGEVKPDMLTG